MDLDDATYKKLLEEGTGDAAFAKQLLDGGETAVKSLNSLDTDLNECIRKTCESSRNESLPGWYRCQPGLVKGLEDR